MSLSDSDRIWNRATLAERRAGLAKGDKALAALLRAHGLSMNGGVLHAAECLTNEDLEAAIAGYEFFGLAQVGSLLRRAKQLLKAGMDLESFERSLDAEYAVLIPSDLSLAEAFERHLRANPSDFAPVRGAE